MTDSSQSPAVGPASVPSPSPTSPEPPALVYPQPLGTDDALGYHALREDAAWLEAPYHWSSVRGPKAVEALNGLVTNDVSQLDVGMAQHAVALTPKGKVVCDLYIVRTAEDTLLLMVPPSCGTAWLELARKYINPRLAKVTDESAQWGTWLLFGVQAEQAVGRLGAATPSDTSRIDGAPHAASMWPEWSHQVRDIGPARVHLVRAPIAGRRPGFILFADRGDADVLRAHLAAAVRPASRGAWEVVRIESGRPAFGVDMDENTIPQEANLDQLGAISFTKGCYTGQETVARVHFRGHVNRHLRGLQASQPIPQHARVTDAAGKDVGDVRSTAISPRLGPIALAMIRREVAPGTDVRVNGEQVARVIELPFAE